MNYSLSHLLTVALQLALVFSLSLHILDNGHVPSRQALWGGKWMTLLLLKSKNFQERSNDLFPFNGGKSSSTGYLYPNFAELGWVLNACLMVPLMIYSVMSHKGGKWYPSWSSADLFHFCPGGEDCHGCCCSGGMCHNLVWQWKTLHLINFLNALFIPVCNREAWHLPALVLWFVGDKQRVQLSEGLYSVDVDIKGSAHIQLVPSFLLWMRWVWAEQW